MQTLGILAAALVVYALILKLAHLAAAPIAGALRRIPAALAMRGLVILAAALVVYALIFKLANLAAVHYVAAVLGAF